MSLIQRWEDVTGLLCVNFSAMSNLDNQDDVVGFDCEDNSVVIDSEASGAFQTVAEGLSKFDRMRGELRFNGRLDSALRHLRKTRNIGRNNAVEVLNSIFQGQALSCETRFSLAFNRSSAMREK